MKLLRLLLATLAVMAAVVGARATENPSALIPRYEKIAAALVADNFAGAQAAARQLAAEADRLHHAGLAAAAQAGAQAGDLTAARGAFKTLRTETIALARRQKGYFIMTCPMTQADWAQRTREVANPHLGKVMLACGDVKEEPNG
jgi:hypothetical protein